MPELPEVETVRRGLEPALVGRRVAAVEQRRPDLRIPFPDGFPALVAGQTVTAIRRKAKYLLFDLDGGLVLICHLGMSGRFSVLPRGDNRPPDPHDHAIFATDEGSRVVFNDPRRFGLMTLARAGEEESHPLLAALAPDPLDPAFTAGWLARRLAGKATSIKAALLDQKAVGGVGNIYACEALHRAGVSPRRLARSVVGRRCERLADALVDVLTRAIAAGGSSLRDHRRTDGELGYFQHDFRVYGRAGEPCQTPGCAGAVRRIAQSNRSTFFCGLCQR